MLEMESRIRKWVRSMGVVIPMEKIKEEHLKEDEAITIWIKRKKRLNGVHGKRSIMSRLDWELFSAD